MKLEKRQTRNAEIYTLYLQGLSKSEIARAKRLSPQHVSRIIKTKEATS